MLVLVLVPFLLVLVAQASNGTPPRFTLSGGGGTSFSDNFILDGTLGQGQPVGTSFSPNFQVKSGFWAGLAGSGPAGVPGDVNRDGRTDGADLRIVAAALGTSPSADPRTDLNGDNRTDILDLVRVAKHFLKFR